MSLCLHIIAERVCAGRCPSACTSLLRILCLQQHPAERVRAGRCPSALHILAERVCAGRCPSACTSLLRILCLQQHPAERVRAGRCPSACTSLLTILCLQRHPAERVRKMSLCLHILADNSLPAQPQETTCAMLVEQLYTRFPRYPHWIVLVGGLTTLSSRSRRVSKC